MYKKVISCLVSGIFVFGNTAVGFAEEAPASEEESKSEKVLDRITVVGSGHKSDEVPGSAHFINKEQLEKTMGAHGDIHRVLRQVPGVNIQEEDGYGLRPNIGFRGTPNERSSRITLMEDSILIAPAPYAAPSAYYFPVTGRMEGVEVLKGASQLKYGPYTTGGSLNLFSTSIPEEDSISGDIAFGSDNLKRGHIHGGTSWKHGGVMLETYQIETDGFKDLDGGGETGFDVEDYTIKTRLNTDPEEPFYQQIEYKLGLYDQVSNETYLGLTQEDFDADPYRRYSASQVDNMDVDHVQHHVTHYVELSEKFDLTTSVYRNDTQRNWYKLQSVNGNGIAKALDNAEDLAVIKGGNSDDDALKVRANQREYESYGIQSVLAGVVETGSTQHNFEFGARYHEDEEDRLQHEDGYRMENGTMVLTSRGAPGSNANRIGEAEAWAFYLQDKISIDKLTLTPTVRYETIDYTRKDYGKSDPSRSGSSLKTSKNDIDEVIPGIGAHYQVSQEVALFGGVHKGFAPPGPTSSGDVEEEESVNYELGANYADGSFFSEAIFFYNDYDNLLGADTLSAGGDGSGDLHNGGEVEVIGAELDVRYDFGADKDIPVLIPVRANYTFTSAEFQDNFDSDFFGIVSDGDDVPYIPEHQTSVGVAVEGKESGLRLAFDAHWIDSMATVPGQAGTVSEEKTDSYFVADITASAPVPKLENNARLYLTVENVFDEDYVVARRPAGARPGKPLTVMGGIKFDL